MRIDAVPDYAIADPLLANEGFRSIWENSDLSKVIGRLAEAAANHSRHLRKHPEKTDAKIWM